MSRSNDLQVLYEDNHLIAVNKRSGDIVQGDKTGDEPLSDRVKAYIKRKYDKPGDVYLGVVHRLDRPVSGVVLYARTSKAAARLSRMFQEREVDKTYWAVVRNRPAMEEDTLVLHLRKNERQNKSYPANEGAKGAKRCELHYRLNGVTDRYWLLEVEPITGRHHQIRAQLAAIGSPIKGDVKYGADRPNKDGSIHLHARSIHFQHPVKKESMTITAPLPEDNLWKALSGQ
jgi:23S rRNA pseudouridine1911/1915/1917 synthase